MRTLLLLLAIVCFAGCQKKQELPTREVTNNNIVKTSQFSITTDSLIFRIPIDPVSGVSDIKVKGTLVTSLSPEYSSYVVLSAGESVLWYSSFLEPSLEFTTKNLSGVINGSYVECRLEFHNISDIHGPFKCSGSIVFSK